MRSGDTRAMVARPRLLALLGDARVVLLEAPGGFGKTTTARQLAAALDRPLLRVVLSDPAEVPDLLATLAQAARRAGLPALAETLDPDDATGSLDRLSARLAVSDGVVIAVDELQRASVDAAAWLVRLAQAMPPQVRLVLAGRRLGATVRDLTDLVDAVLLGADVLRMDRAEVATVLGSDPHPDSTADPRVAAVLEATDGWPAAVALAVALGTAGTDPGTDEGGRPRRVLRILVDELLAAAAPGDRDTIARLGALPLLSGPLAAAVGGPGTLERLLDLGLPVRFRPDGWGELPDPVRELLPTATIDAAVARAVAAAYAERGALGEAAGVLRRAGDPEGVAGLLASVDREALVAAGVAAISAIAADLPDPVLATNPSLLVHLVQVVERRSPLRRAWLDHALRLLPDGSA